MILTLAMMEQKIIMNQKVTRKVILNQRATVKMTTKNIMMKEMRAIMMRVMRKKKKKMNTHLTHGEDIGDHLLSFNSDQNLKLINIITHMTTMDMVMDIMLLKLSSGIHSLKCGDPKVMILLQRKIRSLIITNHKLQRKMKIMSRKILNQLKIECQYLVLLVICSLIFIQSNVIVMIN